MTEDAAFLAVHTIPTIPPPTLMKTLLTRTWLAGFAVAVLAAPALRAEISDWAPVVDPVRGSMNVNSSKSAFSPQLVTFNAKLYAAWRENGGSTGSVAQIRVAVYNGNNNAPSWSQVDSRMNGMARSTSQGINFDVKMAAEDGPSVVEHNGSLYAAWSEGDNSVYRVRVARYNGNDANPNWISVNPNAKSGLNFSGSKSARSVQLVSFNGQLFAFWREQGGSGRGLTYQLRARAYNEGTNTWTWVDGGQTSGLNIDPSKNIQDLTAVRVQVAGLQAKLYLSFIEANASNVSLVRVKVYGGGASWFSADGGKGLNINQLESTDPGILSDLEAEADARGVYFAWSENAGSTQQVRVVHFAATNDNDPKWLRLDGDDPQNTKGLNYDAGTIAWVNDLQTMEGKIYVAWRENASTRAAVGEWDDANNAFRWSWVDGGGPRGNVQVNEAADGRNVAFGVFGGQLFAFTSEGPFDGLRTGYVSVGIEAVAP